MPQHAHSGCVQAQNSKVSRPWSASGKNDDMFLMCFYWSMGHSLILGQDKSEWAFPEFAEKVFNEEGAVNSRVSRLFANHMRALGKIISNHVEGEAT